MSECTGNCASCQGHDTRTIYDLGTRKEFKSYPSDFCYPFNAVLNLTDECTHRCKMCFVDFNPRRMTYETAEKAVEFIKSNCEALKVFGDNYKPSIIFFGGEPLLEYNTIIVPLIEKYGDEIKWGITTNGYLLDEDKVDFFRKHDVNILFSFDGDKYTQNLQRPLKNGKGSFEENVKRIPYYVLRYKNSEMRATVTKESIPYLYENFLFAEKMGFSSVDFVIDGRNEIQYTEEEERILSHQIDKIVAHIISKLLLTNEPVIQFNNLIKAFTTVYTNDRTPFFNNEVYRCGTGITSVGIGVDGKIYPCQEESSSNMDDIGDIFTGINKEKHWAHIQTYMRTVDYLGRRMEPNGFNLYQLSYICPNHLLEKGGLGQGTEIMNKAMYNASVKLLRNHADSPNERVFNYFYRGGRRD